MDAGEFPGRSEGQSGHLSCVNERHSDVTVTRRLGGRAGGMVKYQIRDDYGPTASANPGSPRLFPFTK